jgi:Tfp pilus assembly protein PilF
MAIREVGQCLVRYSTLAFLGAAIGISASMTGCATASKHEMSSQDRARTLLVAAAGSLSEHDPTGALQTLVEAEEIDNTLPELYHLRALAFYAKHNLNLAIVNARRAVQMQPDFAEANSTLGKFLLDAGRLDEAKGPLKVAAKNPLYRDSYKPKTTLGIIHYQQGNYDQALASLDSAILDSPGAACIAYYYRGHIEMSRKQFKQAAKDYDSATRKICASFADAHLALGIAYEKERDYTRARKKFLDVTQNFPNTKVAEQALDRLRYLP